MNFNLHKIIVHFSLQDFSYKFKALRELNNVTYTCEFDVPDFSSVKENVKVLIKYSPVFKFNQNETKVDVVHGSRAILNCENDSNPPATISWLFKSEILDFHENILSVENANEKQAGKYLCQVENEFGKLEKNFEVEIIPKGPVKFSKHLDHIVVNEGDSVEFICEVYDALPLVNFSWSVEESENVKIFSENEERKVLKINEAKTSESFECIVENKFGIESKFYDLIVQIAARVDSILFIENDREIEDDEKIVKLKDETLSFECSYDGFPAPEMKWLKNGNEMKLAEDDDQTILKFNKISSEEHDGNYTCVVENLLGNSSKSFSIQVHSRPKLKKSSTTTLTVIENSEVEMLCEFDGKPIPTVSWLSNNQLEQSTGNSLSFKSQLGHSGVYKCIGSNEYGEDSTEFTLVVMGE